VAGSVIASFASQGLLLVTGVLVARALGPTDRGYLALLFLLPGVLQQVGTIGLPLATTYFIARDPSEERHIRRLVRAPGVVQTVALIATQAIVLWFLVRDEADEVQLAAVLSLPVLVGALADMYGKAIVQGQRRYGAFNLLRNGAAFLYMLAVVGLVAVGDADLVNVSVAWVGANLVAGALTIAVAIRPRPLPPQSDGDTTRGTMVRFGLRGWLGSLSPTTTFRLDQAVVGLFLAPQQLGLYVAALAFTNLPTFISRGVAMIALPQVARPGRQGGEVRSFFVLTMVVTGAVIVALEITAGWLVPFFFGEDFEAAVPITRILLVSSFFYGARRVLTDAVSGAGRPGLGSIAELSSWIVLVPLLLIFTPLWGLEGVAAALAVSSAASLGVFLRLLGGLRTLGGAPGPVAGAELDQ
jgi:O-antigen/teichoic acid export membrane protein